MQTELTPTENVLEVQDAQAQNQLAEQLNQAEIHLLTIRDFVRFGVSMMREYDVFVGQGTSDHFAESAAMVLQTLSLEWSADPEILDAKLIPHEKQQVLAILQERITTRKPLSYLLNLSYFCDMPFYVDERVLIPRSPIAELIKQQFFPYFTVNDAAKPIMNAGTVEATYFDHGLPESQHKQPEQILDLCTGSACIAIALAKYFEDAAVDATDIDDDALEVAATNVDYHGLGHQVNLMKSDLFEKISPEQQYELIVTNPPYVDAEDMANLPPEFVHEPEHALAAGQDGLDLVHHILHDAPDYLSENGLLVVEVGNSAWALKQSYPKLPFHWLRFLNGGTGIFALTRNELVAYRDQFKAHSQAIPRS